MIPVVKILLFDRGATPHSSRPKLASAHPVCPKERKIELSAGVEKGNIFYGSYSREKGLLTATRYVYIVDGILRVLRVNG
jgi:hypothetical protein